jgi:tRNA nucleotidyltransferase (CCA-adding enzyme)
MQLDLPPGARAVIDACRAAGFRPLVVGGTIRDALLGRKSKDVDLEVHGAESLAQIAAALARTATFVEQGASFGILSARIGADVIELSLAPSPSVEESFARRDFTVNAMGWDPATGEIIDPFGGRRDLAKKVLRHTSSHFADDPLRVLRGVRFIGQLDFRFAAGTKGLCRTLSDQFDGIATERVWSEWRRLARTATHWPEALSALVDTGWVRHFPELASTRGVPQDIRWHAEGDVWTHLGLAAQEAALAAESDGLAADDREVVVLAALLHDLGKVTHTEVTPTKISSNGHAEAGIEPARTFLRSIGAPSSLVTRVLPLIGEHMTHVSTKGAPSRPAVRRLMRRLSLQGANIADWARVVDADCAGRVPAKASPTPDWMRIAATTGGEPAPRILTGAHLIEHGFVPGPAFSTILDAAADAQDREMFDDEAGALRWLEDVHTPDRPRDLATYPSLPQALAKQLSSVECSANGDLRYAPCRVTLHDGAVLERVIIAESVRVQQRWGRDVTESSPTISEVARIESSPWRLPAELATKIYQEHESGMGYFVFTVVMRDGTRLAFSTGNVVDFPLWPKGVDPADAVDVVPHAGRELLRERSAMASAVEGEVQWILYSA